MGGAYCLLWLCCTWLAASQTMQSINTNCMCDITTSCDNRCCCDATCQSSSVLYWSENNLCYNDGLPIPLCSALGEETYHVHDLYQGLRLIYTVIKRMFCISTINFVDATSAFQASSSDDQIDVTQSTVSALKPSFAALTTIATYPSLPQLNSMGVCQATTALREKQSVIGQSCRVYLSATSALSTNALLSVSQFVTANSLDDTQFRVFSAENPSLFSQSSVAASTISTSCTTSGSNSICTVLKELNLFFIQGTNTIDYSASYAIVSQATIGSGGSYLRLRYSYRWMDSSANLPYSSNIAYAWKSELVFLKQDSSNYYRMFNPLNLAFKKLDGTCRTATSDSASPQNLITIRFGVNSIHSCVGTTTLLNDNIKGAISHVGSIGSASDNLNDYLAISFGTTITNTNSLQLLFYYSRVGTQSNPQFKIVSAELNGITATSTNQPSLFIEFEQIPSSVILHIPSPPKVDAYLPDDFLYPFYVA